MSLSSVIVSLRRGFQFVLAAALVGVLAGCATAAAPGAAHGSSGIVAAPTRTAHTALGEVSYREIGHGPALVMITGFGATMDDWAPYFVDALAEHYRVVVFDNAGVGKTSPLAAPLSVPEMAGQTSALITTLRLGPCDVLGWSMGGMIAQSLAVTHPSQVRSLVLASTQPGTGNARPVSATAQAALDAGGGAAIGLLFPSSQKAAAQRYVLSILAYPDHYAVSGSVRDAQQAAVDQWFAGKVTSGREVNSIHAPTLVADGTEDALDPASNDRLLAGLIPTARLVLYPGAGHGFFLQDPTAFLTTLRSFLG